MHTGPLTPDEIERLKDEYDADGVWDDFGVISVHTFEPRGDGGPVPWLKLVGAVGDIRTGWNQVDTA